jgi:DSF synthase
MAVSTRSLHALLARTDNDNLPLRSAGAARPNVLPFVPRNRTLDLDYPNLATRFEAETGILWARMKHRERACYTPEIMRDMRDFQLHLRDLYAGASLDECPIRWLVWASDAPKAWSLGGDLQTFTRMIRAGDEAGLRAYAHLAIDILYDNLICMDLPILTVALITGDAIGGGFEAMLTDDVVIAERGAKFGLPEILFNLFPGMGAYSFLKRKVGPGLAKQLVEDGITRSAEELRELGLIDRVCDPGRAEACLRELVAESAARFRTVKTLRQVQHRVDPITRRELLDVVDLWVDLAMRLSDNDLRRMDCLARVQERKRAAG